MELVAILKNGREFSRYGVLKSLNKVGKIPQLKFLVSPSFRDSNLTLYIRTVSLDSLLKCRVVAVIKRFGADTLTTVVQFT